MTNLKLLKEKINESGYKLLFIAKCIGITRTSLLNKVGGKYDFKNREIHKLADLLRLSNEERDVIFFANSADTKTAL